MMTLRQCSTEAFKGIVRALPPKLVRKVAYRMLPDEMRNINLNLANPSQRNVLICYITIHKVDLREATHANALHINQMIHYFVQRDYCVDVCSCHPQDFDIRHFQQLHYEVLIGFGEPFKQLARAMDIPVKISFITENDPEVVAQRYAQRMAYFKQRHPNVKVKDAVARDNYFDTEQFDLADYGIHMNSLYNAKSLQNRFKRLWTVNANAIVNADFQFRDEEIRARIPSTKRKFLWFGSLGLIHKGVDILMDALNVLPDCSCDFYGVSDREKELFMHLKAGNANYCGRINVQSRRFIDEVALDHCFLVFPSCSEGMSTAVCTCMAAGIIPIVTQVSGFDPHPGIIYLEDESVEGVANAMRRALEMPDEEILRMRRTVYEYANQAFSIQHFDRQFTDIMDELLEDAGV